MPEPIAPSTSIASAPRTRAWLWAGMSLSVAALLSACQTPPSSAPQASATVNKLYRQDAAQHIYARNADRIYKGKLPPLLYAIGVLQVQIDAQGRIKNLHWMRKPTHAPEVVAEIERTVRAASPFPAPGRTGAVSYTDTWLWDESGRFQLDTLTEGQLSQ